MVSRLRGYDGRMSSELSADVVVVGSGAAGLSAAVSAAVELGEGGSVLLLERSDRLGGTTAVSGGVAWLPNNDHMRELELPDSPQQALTYLRAISLGRADPALLEAFVAAAPEAARFLEAETPLRLSAAGRGNPAGGVLPFPDYQSDLPGGTANGRSLDPAPFDPSALGDLAEAMRDPLPYSASWSGGGLVLDSGEWAGGRALAGALIAGCLAHGVRIERGVRALRLLATEDGGVAGLEAEQAGETLRIEARRGVVLAAGGFEWDAELRRDWLRGPVDALLSPPGLNEGDALRMAMERGAAVANLGEAWWTLAVRLTGEGASADDAQGELRFLSGPRSLPGSILVNRLGRRFVNEAVNYHDIVRAFHVFDPGAFTYPNRPAWFLFGESYRRAYGLLSAAPDAARPALAGGVAKPRGARRALRHRRRGPARDGRPLRRAGRAGRRPGLRARRGGVRPRDRRPVARGPRAHPRPDRRAALLRDRGPCRRARHEQRAARQRRGPGAGRARRADRRAPRRRQHDRRANGPRLRRRRRDDRPRAHLRLPRGPLRRARLTEGARPRESEGPCADARGIARRGSGREAEGVGDRSLPPVEREKGSTARLVRDEERGRHMPEVGAAQIPGVHHRRQFRSERSPRQYPLDAGNDVRLEVLFLPAGTRPRSSASRRFDERSVENASSRRAIACPVGSLKAIAISADEST